MIFIFLFFSATWLSTWVHLSISLNIHLKITLCNRVKGNFSNCAQNTYPFKVPWLSTLSSLVVSVTDWCNRLDDEKGQRVRFSSGSTDRGMNSEKLGWRVGDRIDFTFRNIFIQCISILFFWKILKHLFFIFLLKKRTRKHELEKKLKTFGNN